MSLTSVLCKIFETLFKKALLLFLTETRSLSPSQHGFLPRRYCLSNLILQEERVTRKTTVSFGREDVPLGSVVGPLLLLLFMNNLPSTTDL